MKLWNVIYYKDGYLLAEIGFGETEQEAITSVNGVMDPFARAREFPIPDGWELRRKASFPDGIKVPPGKRPALTEELQAVIFLMNRLGERIAALEKRVENPPPLDTDRR